jgi:Fe-S-cluster-containing dehydrogenase component
MARLSMLIDVTKCSGCHNCYLACRDEYYDNDYPGYSAPQPLTGQYWMQIKEIERGTWPKPKVDYIPLPCQNCENAPCVPKLDYVPLPCQNCEEAPCIEVAADGAVYRRKDGIVIIDPIKAKGQKDIVNSCPYRVIYWNADLELPQKCTFCAHMLDAGEPVPRCVEACPTGALLFGDLDDPKSEISQAVKALQTEDYHPEFGTSPLVQYVGIPKKFIVGEVVRRDMLGECAEGVEVTLEGDGVKSVTQTDNFGDFEFEGLEKDKQLQLRVDLKGYASMIIDVDTHTDRDLGEIVLEPLK